ncbi:hypothetical protein NLJ89_g4659 [Agrocybe chaxingu]|uniref:Vacuolar calcium ion transporter n=1 Tax=Agrocybe chaxingu TaxID=84603 RepID=A0A9W8K019_9AGAR|nr:hypothetical protein NLJ89_g4659 [Agrocybe chaxingu]
MGESFALPVHNATNTVLPQPTPALLAEDDDEPPSSGPRNEPPPQMTTPAPGGQSNSRPANGVREKDFVHVDREVTLETIETVDVKDDVPVSNIPGEDLEKLGERRVRRRIRLVKLSKTARIRALFTPKHVVGPTPTYLQSVKAMMRYTPLNLLLLCIPVSWALHFTHQSPTLIFVFSGLGIVPLAALLGLGTEQIALRTSQSIGGLLNASLGNLIEMIISGIALKQCELEVVQSALLGSLLSNLLLVLGCAFVVGGFRFHQQQFQPMVAQLNSSLLIVSVISLAIPAAFHQYLESRLPVGSEVGILLDISRGSAIILMSIYFFYLFFQFYSHNHLFLDTVQEYSISTRSSSSASSLSRRSTQQTLPVPVVMEDSCSSSSSSSSSDEVEVPKLNMPSAFMLLCAITGFAYVTADFLIESLEGLVESNPSISKEWVTLIIIPILGNAAEHTTAVIVASKGKFDLAMSVAVGSCIQIAMFVIPILVMVAWGMGKPLTLLFDPLETIVLFLTVVVVKFSVEDGKTHWMTVYILIAMAFWHFPSDTVRIIQGQPLQCIK